jgi:hypothetical protein
MMQSRGLAVSQADAVEVLRPYTRAEAMEAVRRFREGGRQLRSLLLDMYERGAHEAMGFHGPDAWDQFVHSHLGAEWRPPYLRQLLVWARVERDIQSHEPLSRRMAHALAKLPDARLRLAAWTELQEGVVAAGRGLKREHERDLEGIVGRLLLQAMPAKAERLAISEPPRPEPEPEPEREAEPEPQRVPDPEPAASQHPRPGPGPAPAPEPAACPACGQLPLHRAWFLVFDQDAQDRLRWLAEHLGCTRRRVVQDLITAAYDYERALADEECVP